MNFNLTQIFDKDTSVSELSDPFQKECIQKIYICFRNSEITNTCYWHGSVDFKKGNTTGQQDFDNEETFEAIVKKVEAFIKEL